MAKEKKQDAAQKVRLVCNAGKRKGAWIEYDVTEWGWGMYSKIFGNAFTAGEVLNSFIPEYSTNWHIVNSDDTAVVHPGPIKEELRRGEVWSSIWGQFDVETSRALHGWLTITPLLAAQEAMRLPPFLPGDDRSNGAGAEEAGERDDSEPAD